MADNPLRTCILSHGRSGTLYTAKVMQSLGLDFGHEKDGKDGAIGGTFFTGTRDLSSYEQIFHQVRHPLDVISSSTTCKKSSFAKTYKDIGLEWIEEKGKLKMCMLSWLIYTDWADSKASWTYKIEDFDVIFPELMSRMGIETPVLPDVSKDTNKREYTRYEWRDLYDTDDELTKVIRKRALKYEYKD